MNGSFRLCLEFTIYLFTGLRTTEPTQPHLEVLTVIESSFIIFILDFPYMLYVVFEEFNLLLLINFKL